jgi:thiamine-phosphate pyrophosphorylase
VDPASPRLHAILDIDVAATAGWQPAALAAAFLEGGARVIQVRAKRLASGPFLEVCEAVVALARAHRATVIVNDRVDLALMARADGVHLGQDDLPVSDARVLLGPHAIVGCSTHTVEQIEAAATLPCSYIAVGPVFGTRTKETGYDAVGLDRVAAAVARAGSRPVVAIGGIRLETAASVIAAGATAVAVISDLLATGDPAGRVAAYVSALRETP